MRFSIEDYNLGCKVFSITFNEEIYNEIKGKELNVAIINSKNITFWPESKTFQLSNKDYNNLICCQNYDVLYINEDGNGFSHYSNESDDNPLILTQKCNSNCIMCPTTEFVRKKENEMWIDAIIESIKYIPNDARHLTITGGEPFLVKEKIFTLLETIKYQLPYTECLLLTNGRALSYKPYAEAFSKTSPDNMIIGIPLHGYNEITHDYITQSPGGFKQTITGIQNLLYYGFNVEIRLVISKLNYQYIDKIAELIISELPSVSSVKIMGLEMLGNAAKNSDKVWIPYRTAFEHSKNAIINLINHNINIGLYNFPLCAVDRDCHLLCAKSITGYKIRYDEKCNTCKKRESCGGIFSGTIRLAGKDVIPWC